MSEFFVKSNKFKRLKFEDGPNYQPPKNFKIYIKPKSGKPSTDRDPWGNDRALAESDAYLRIGDEYLVIQVRELQKMMSLIESVTTGYLRDRDSDLRAARTDIMNLVFDVDPNQEPF
jgi:hypothetical protein